MIGRGPADATARAVGLELSARRPGVEHLADLDTAGDEFVARSLDVGDDQVQALGRAGRGRRDLRAELDRAPRAGRRELDDPEAVIEREVGVEPPPEFRVELLRAVDIRDGDDDDLELQVDFGNARVVVADFLVHFESPLSEVFAGPNAAARPKKKPALPVVPARGVRARSSPT